MKTIYTIMLVLLLSGSSIAQKKIHNILSKSLPENLELSKERQKFKVTTNHYNGDIFGNLFNKQQVYGEYTRGLDEWKVKCHKGNKLYSGNIDFTVY